MALTRFAWTRPDLDRVDLYVESDKAASIAVAEHAGYLRLGLLPGHHEIGAAAATCSTTAPAPDSPTRHFFGTFDGVSLQS